VAIMNPLLPFPPYLAVLCSRRWIATPAFFRKACWRRSLPMKALMVIWLVMQVALGQWGFLPRGPGGQW
jgi:hypothetical protein